MPIGDGRGRFRRFKLRRNLKERNRQGRGRNQGTNPGAGVGGECICSSCGEIISHETGEPCYKRSCPNCGKSMIRRF